MAAMFMIAIEATIVSTAMPQIVGRLGGLPFYSWVFAAFLLTQTATTVIFGKFSDLFGRKMVMLFGIAVFLIGSVLCGFAWSMPSMVVFRFIQGIGAGAILPVAMTVVGDLYSAQERGKIQGYLASVWALSAVLGPLAGGLIVQHFSWAWIFWLNIPIGLLAAVGFWFNLHENIVSGQRSIDYLGALLFAIAIAALMVGLTAISTSDWRGTSAMAALFVASAVLFVVQERRAPEPMIAFELWARRPIAAANGASLLGGMAMIGVTTFLPVYVQAVMKQSPLVAGFALSVMVLGWPVGATLATRILGRFGVRPVLLTGSLFIPSGAVLFLALGPDQSPYLAGAGSLIMGFGMGLLSSASIVLIQEIVAWSERGSATASFLFARSLGNTLGATIFGAVLNYGLAHANGGETISSDQLRLLMEGTAANTNFDASVRAVLESSLHLTFVAMFVITALTVALAALVPPIALSPRPVPAE
jgi:EmrB/QacA subfamily drug resistance transporter